MEPAIVGKVFAIIQGIVAFVGVVINIYFLMIAIRSNTKMKQLYTFFTCLFLSLMIIHCFVILLTFPQFFFDTNKVSIVYAYFNGGSFSKIWLLIFMFISELKFAFYLSFFVVRYYAFQLTPTSNVIINLVSILAIVFGISFATTFYYAPYIIQNWSLPFNSTQYPFSLSDATYLRYDRTFDNLQAIFAFPIIICKITLICFYIVIICFFVAIRHEIGVFVGSTYSQNIHKATICYIFYQVTVTFILMLPFYLYEIVITCWPDLYSYTVGLFFFTLQPLYVLVVPFFNCGIKEWQDAERLHKNSNAIAPYTTPNTEVESRL